MKKYCSGLPTDKLGKLNLSTPCKNHDNNVGQRGTYRLDLPTYIFYKDLVSVGMSKPMSFIVATLGLIGQIIKYPYLAYKIYKYRKANNG